MDSADDYWNGGSGWEPIGDSSTAFNAVFDGNGHTITDLFIDRSSTRFVGLFGYTGSSSAVRQVGMRDASVQGSAYVGVLAGQSDGSITSSYATGSVRSGHFVGGLAGVNSGTGGTSYAAVSVDGTQNNVGGLVGQSTGRISESYARGAVQGAGNSSYVGGLVGWSRDEGEITDSYAKGQVSGGSAHVGGLTGSDDGTTTDSYWDTATTGQSSSGSGTGKTTSALQSPTANTGIYTSWDSVVWDFGTAQQYPVLQVDFDDSGTAAWEAFAKQRVTFFDPDGSYRILTSYVEDSEIELNDYLATGVTGVTFALQGGDCDSPRADYYSSAAISGTILTLSPNALGHVHGPTTQTETACTVTATDADDSSEGREFSFYLESNGRPRTIRPGSFEVVESRVSEIDVTIDTFGTERYIRLGWREADGGAWTFRLAHRVNFNTVLTIPDLTEGTEYEIAVNLLTRQSFDLFRAGNTGGPRTLIEPGAYDSKWLDDLIGNGMSKPESTERRHVGSLLKKQKGTPLNLG